MINNLASLALILVLSSVVNPAVQSKTIRFALKDGKELRIHVGDEALLFEVGNTLPSYLFTTEAIIKIDHRARTYSIQTVAGLLAELKRKVAEQPEGAAGRQARIEINLTDQTDVVAGLKARRLVVTADGFDWEMWVRRELLPPRLRAAGDEMRGLLPPDYWTKKQSGPGWMETTMMYGVPLRIVLPDSREAIEASIGFSTASFQVPAGYTKVEH